VCVCVFVCVCMCVCVFVCVCNTSVVRVLEHGLHRRGLTGRETLYKAYDKCIPAFQGDNLAPDWRVVLIKMRMRAVIMLP